MTKKSKIITLVVALLVIIAGGSAFYLKGDDLMGRMSKKSAVNSSTQCPSDKGTLLFSSNISLASGVPEHSSFTDFLKAFDSSGHCPYAISFVENETLHKLICKPNELKHFEQVDSLRCERDFLGGEAVLWIDDSEANFSFVDSTNTYFKSIMKVKNFFVIEVDYSYDFSDLL
ncbi:hypothetical protein HOG17_04615 [Candidatus Peregrinibacteria bacterium]|jgi:hypothetical protein|nr:hypothetical protein [Candidatus Peregrinibacteria bacterium]MBT4147849.1 hypothetical protein [Candidatus Peregrinibacteria bacterium]MBT4366190.1 hypothetical protein [Candidatus Peregrinibacteria bacterium]MBT4455595.1 hypothetical protein [Candidatus Peregrinibacteria bacterium]